jgi:hypothetical protein
MKVIEKDRGAGSYESHGAADDGTKTHGHEQSGNGNVEPFGDPLRGRKEKGRCADILHHARYNRHGSGDQGHYPFFTAAAQLNDRAGNLVHYSGLVQACANDDHCNYGDHCVTAQPQKSLFGSYKPDEGQKHHHQNAHHVHPNPLEYE